MKKIILVGCGNIGMRHLQSMQKMVPDSPVTIDVVEPSTNQAQAIHNQFADVENSALSYQLHQSIPDTRKAYDLAVIATNSSQRRSVFEELIKRHSIGSMIFEKVLFTNHRDIDEVGSMLDKHKIQAYVNCARRAFPGYQDLKGKLAGKGPVDLQVTGANYGLASNGVHFLDLAEFLNGHKLSKVDSAGLKPGSVPSKRQGYVEIFGELQGELENGAKLSISCDDEGAARVGVKLVCQGMELEIDEGGKSIRQTKGDNFLKSNIFESRFLSETPEVYGDILFNGPLRLTSYEDSSNQHKLFIDALRPHLGLSNSSDQDCPIS